MYKNLKTKLLLIGMLSTVVLMLSACNTVRGTVHGAGEDLETVSRM